MIAVKAFLTCLAVFVFCFAISRKPVEDRPWVFIPGSLSIVGMVISAIASIWMM